MMAERGSRGHLEYAGELRDFLITQIRLKQHEDVAIHNSERMDKLP
jgi:hypothetical protein